MKFKLGGISAVIILFLSVGSAIFSALHLPAPFIPHELQIQSVTAAGPESITNSTDILAIDGESSSDSPGQVTGIGGDSGSGSQFGPSSNNPSTSDTGGCGIGTDNPNCCDPNDPTCQNKAGKFYSSIF